MIIYEATINDFIKDCAKPEVIAALVADNLLKKAGKEAWEDEIDNQICQTKAQLEALGVVVESLKIK